MATLVEGEGGEHGQFQRALRSLHSASPRQIHPEVIQGFGGG